MERNALLVKVATSEIVVNALGVLPELLSSHSLVDVEVVIKQILRQIGTNFIVIHALPDECQIQTKVSVCP